MPKPTKNPGVVTFEGVITGSDSSINQATWIDFPYDLKELYGIGNLVPVIVRFDDVEYRGSIAKMGGEYPMLLIRKDVLAQLGKKYGDTVTVQVTLDDKPREVSVPIELTEALNKQPAAIELFQRLAYTHRKEYTQWVGGAKQLETRKRRADKAVEMILNSKKIR